MAYFHRYDDEKALVQIVFMVGDETYHTVLVKDNGKGSKKDNIWVIVNAQASMSFGFTMLIHSNILYTAGVSGSWADVHGEVSGRDTHKADIVRLSGLSVGAVITRIRAKCPIRP